MIRLFPSLAGNRTATLLAVLVVAVALFMLPLVAEWGKQQGCTSMSLTGRRGWERTFLKREGWTANLVVMTKDL